MPSLNRPNAPGRLPSSDFGDLFFKPRQQRASDPQSATSTPSPLSTPANVVTSRRAFRASEGANPYTSSPLASTATGITQRRQIHLERSAYWSENSARSPVQSPNAPDIIREETTPSIHRTPSVASRAPREPRKGFKWTRDFLGVWIEIRVGRPKGSAEGEPDEPPKSVSDEFSPPLYTPPLETASSSPPHLSLSHTTTNAGTACGRPLLPETPDDFGSASTLGPVKEGLYCRTKRALGLKHGAITLPVETRSKTPTGGVLNRVTSTLRFLPQRTFTGSSNAATSVTSLSIAAPLKRRNRPGYHPGWSASSSVRNLVMGGPPAATPEPEAIYTSSDSNTYISVDLTQPAAPKFLPSEARRINTPPLPNERSKKTHPRGFFFDYTPPAERDMQAFSKRPSPPRKSMESVEHSREDDWYRVKLEAIDNEVAAPREEPDFDVPEHFPNSPLCPRHPKHKSGGTGTCPYHGRNKSTPSDSELPSTAIKTGSLTPVSEKWWLR